MRRAQDSLNPRTQADVIVLADEQSDIEEGDHPHSARHSRHPYWYARVLGVFHTHIRHSAPRALGASSVITRVDFLWVRWFEIDTTYAHGFAAKRLPRVRFVETPDALAFGFLNPADVVRATHLIPAFAHDHRRNLPPSLARPHHPTEEWHYHYVNM